MTYQLDPIRSIRNQLYNSLFLTSNVHICPSKAKHTDTSRRFIPICSSSHPSPPIRLKGSCSIHLNFPRMRTLGVVDLETGPWLHLLFRIDCCWTGSGTCSSKHSCYTFVAVSLSSMQHHLLSHPLFGTKTRVARIVSLVFSVEPLNFIKQCPNQLLFDVSTSRFNGNSHDGPWDS